MNWRDIAAIQIAMISGRLNRVCLPVQHSAKDTREILQNVECFSTRSNDRVARKPWLDAAIWIGDELVGVLSQRVKIDPAQVGGLNKVARPITCLLYTSPSPRD